MASAEENQPASEPLTTPADGGTLLPSSPPPGKSEMAQPVPQALSSADSSLISDSSHVQQLINHGADVNAPDNNGWTPLHTAAYHGQEEIVRILLTANADVNARNRTDETPLHLAAKWPQDRVVEALLSGGADVGARNKRGRTPAHVAALFNRHAILDRLLTAGADVNAVDSELQTPLHLAVRCGSPVEPELVKTLIRHSASLELRDVRGNAPLHFLPAAQVGDWLHWAAFENKEGLMAVLLARPGVRPDCYSEEGLTPLHLAAHVNNTNMVSMLLSAGAKVNAPSQPASKTSGKEAMYGIPLPGAPGSITAGISISSQLKAYGSSKLPPGELTALHIAAERGSAELIRVLVAAGAKVNVQGERGMPPLHVAVWEGNTAAVVSLLAAKASVSLKSKAGGFTSVHCACLSSRATAELLALLLDNGGAAVIEERCQEGWTALHLACQSAPPAMVELLLQRGARPGAKGKNGRTAADCAAKRPEILQILHVASGGKVPLPVGLSSVAAAAAANGLLVPNGGSAARGGAAGSSRGRGAACGGAAAGSRGSSSAASSSQSGLLPGTAAVLEPLESVEATLAALLADMGGALCSLQAGAVFGAGACAVDPVGHCIRPLDKRLVMACTLGCQFSFHLQCWVSAREVLKERWEGFTGSLVAGGRYSCIGSGCPGFIREQAICDGTAMQTNNQSRLYLMPQEVYDSLPPQAKPIGGGVPPPPGAGDGCITVGGCGAPQSGTPAQPALPAGGGGGGGLSSLAALGPSLSLAQAMVQAATAMGNMMGSGGRVGASQLAAALAAGGIPALLAVTPPPPVPKAMSAREAAIIAAQTLGVDFGSGGSDHSGSGSGSPCVVEDLDSDDGSEDVDALVAAASTAVTAASPSGGGSGSSGASAGGSGAGGHSGAASGSSGAAATSAASRSGGVASTSASSGGGTATANGSGGGGRKHGGGGGGASSSSRRGGKGGGGGGGKGGKASASSSSASSPICSAAAAEMLQQLQGLQQAVAAVQNAVGAGLIGPGGGGGASASGSAATGQATAGSNAPAVPTVDPGATPSNAESAGATAAAGSAAGGQTTSEGAAGCTTVATLEPPPRDLLPPAGSVPCGGGGDGGGGSDVGGGGGFQDAAPVPPPKRRNPPMPAISRRVPQPLTCTAQENGRQPLSPQLATPPPATSLLTPGVRPLLTPAGGVAVGGVVGTIAGPGTPQQPLRQPDASLAPILVGPVPSPTTASPSAAPANATEQPVTASSPSGASRAGQGAASAVTQSSSAGAVPAAGRCASPTAAAANGGDARKHARGNSPGASASKADVGSATSPAAAAGGSGTSQASPRRSAGGASSSAGSAATTGSSPAATTPSAAGSARSEFLAAIANGQAAAAAYGGRVTLTAPGLSIGFVRGVPLATSTATTTVTATTSATGSPGHPQVQVVAVPGLAVPRTGSGKAQAPGHPGTTALSLNPANFEPGGYARAVCPGLRPGVHRVTHSSGRVPAPPGATIVPATPVVAMEVGEGGSDTVDDVPSPADATAAAPAPSVSGGTTVDASPSAAAAPVSAVADWPAAAAGDVVDRAPEAASEAPPGAPEGHNAVAATAATPPPQAPAGNGLPAEAVGLTREPATSAVATAATTEAVPTTARVASPAAAPLVRPAVPVPVPVPVLMPPPVPVPTPVSQEATDIMLAALRSLQAPPSAAPEATTAAAAEPATAAATAATAPAEVAATGPSAESEGRPASTSTSRHLLLESGDIPLLASTPGMLEAWLSAHVGTHGRLAAHRILAPQAAVAVSLESGQAAAAVAAALRRRSNLLVQPLAVAALQEFPEDEVLAASAQEVAKTGCSPGDRSWMRHMVDVWQRLQTLPPAVRYE